MTEHYIADANKAKIRSLLQEGYTKEKIMELTGLSDRMIRNYTHEIHEQDKELWKQEASESLDSRALTIKRKYQELADICDAIKNDDKKSPRDRIEAGKTSVACDNNIYNMIKEGPLRFNQMITGKALEEKKRNQNVDEV